MLSSICAARVGIVQKRKRKKFELGMAIMKQNLFQDINYTPSPVGRSQAKRRCINLHKFPLHGYYMYVSEGTSSVRNTSYHSPGQEMNTQNTVTNQRKARHSASSTA